MPRGALDASLEELVFALKPKELTNIPVAQGVFVIEMLEKDADHAIGADSEGQPRHPRLSGLG